MWTNRTPARRRLAVESLEARLTPALNPGAPLVVPIPAHPDYPIPAGAVFAAPDGSPTAAGTLAAPTTLANALAVAPAGGTVVLRGGTYRGVGGQAVTKPLTLQPYQQELPWLDGSLVVTGWQLDPASGKWFMSTTDPDGSGPKRWEYANAHADSNFTLPAHPLADHLEQVYVDGQPLDQVGSLAEATSGRFFVDYAADRLYLGDAPAGKTVAVTAYAWGLDLAAAGTTVRGLGFTHYADRAVFPSADFVTLEHNAFTWNGLAGAGINGFASRWGGGDGRGTDTTLRGNTFTANGEAGYGGAVNARFRVEGNTFSFNNVENFNERYSAAGIKVTRAVGSVFVNNLFERNWAFGLWLDINCSDVAVIGNTFRHNEKGGGVFYEISQKGLIAFNVAHDNDGPGVHVWNSHSTRVYNNTLVGNQTNLTIGDTSRDNTNPGEIAAGHTWVARDNVALNNILSNPQPTGPYGTYTANQFHASNAGSGLVSADVFARIDHNAYYREAGAGVYRIRWNRAAGTDPNGANDTPYSTFAGFRADYPAYEVNGFAVDSEPARNFFMDEVGRDLRPHDASEVIGRAAAIPAADAARIRAVGWAVPAGDVPEYLGALPVARPVTPPRIVCWVAKPAAGPDEVVVEPAAVTPAEVAGDAAADQMHPPAEVPTAEDRPLRPADNPLDLLVWVDGGSEADVEGLR